MVYIFCGFALTILWSQVYLFLYVFSDVQIFFLICVSAYIRKQTFPVMNELGNLIKRNKVLIFSRSDCKYTEDIQNIFRSLDVSFTTVHLDSLGENREDLEREIYGKATEKITPTIFINGCQITGSHTIRRYLEDGSLQLMLECRFRGYDYDLLVIGGGSGGIAAAREAGQLGIAVVMCDFVQPTLHGTTWGLGGTCVNVGCVPKKLMHMGAIIGEDLEKASGYGWNLETTAFHNWNTLVSEVQNYIKSLNFHYRRSMSGCGVVYMNVSASFLNANTVRTVNKHGEEMMVRAKEFIIATGGKPAYMSVPGAEYAITSDDIFSLPYHPGNVLIVAASYVALECAGFLNTFGVDTTVCARQKVLGKCDQQMAELIVKHMSHRGVKFIQNTVVDSIVEKTSGEPGTYEVTLTTKGADKIVTKCNTILFAIGRKPNSEQLGLNEAGVKVNPDTGYILVNGRDQTSATHIYAVGDVCEGRAQLTPVAVQTAKYLVRRLYGNEDTLTDHTFIPSTVFTPLEYGYIGLSEEEAIQKYGLGDVKVYHIKYIPPGYCLAPTVDECYGKIVCIKSNDERVFGFHICGPNAGEITQGFALPMKMGARKDDFFNMLPIHNISASVFANAYSKPLSIAEEDKPIPTATTSSTPKTKRKITSTPTSEPTPTSTSASASTPTAKPKPRTKPISKPKASKK